MMIGTDGELLLIPFHKMLGNYRVDVQPVASRVVLISVEFVSFYS
jgi:hypothetical protein